MRLLSEFLECPPFGLFDLGTDFDTSHEMTLSSIVKIRQDNATSSIVDAFKGLHAAQRKSDDGMQGIDIENFRQKAMLALDHVANVAYQPQLRPSFCSLR